MQNRIDFIDWLKATGMLLIVVGHFFGEPFDQFTQPIYPKQLGVAFFVFVMGWGLANEVRPHWQVVYNRLFPMYFWGIAIATFISFVSLITIADPAITNYLPFVAGINVLANFFPSNPTTWFIGTYLHILLLWAIVMRHIQVTKTVIVTVLIFEILFRAMWLDIDRLFTGYMLITNWLSVFLLGMYMKQQTDKQTSKPQLFLCVGLWAIFLGCWAYLMEHFVSFEHSFPFKTVPREHGIAVNITISATITLAYLSNTLLAVAVFQRIKANAVVHFFSRNTIIVFIGHMPLYAVAEPFARLFVDSGWGKRAIMVVVMYVGLSVLSEYLHKMINLNQVKRALWQKLNLSKRISS